MVRTSGFQLGNTGSIPVSFKMFEMGALTSKPYAFTARPWELRTSYSLDFLDGLVSKIRVDCRGLEVMRILPVVYGKINEEWITDKIRFSYDAFKRQRILQVLLREGSKLNYVSLRAAFEALYKSVSAANFLKASFIAGNAVDLETLFTSKMWGRSWFKRTEYLNDFMVNNRTSFYRLKNSFFIQKEFLDTSNYILLIGSNLRYELPLLNLLVKKFSKRLSCYVFSMGPYTKNTYTFNNLGSNLLNIFDIIKGKHMLSNFLLNQKGVFFLGTNYLGFLRVLEQARLFLRVNIYHIPAFNTVPNMVAVNYTSNNEGVANFDGIAHNFYLQAQSLKKALNKSINIFMGSHGFETLEKFDYIFPSAHFFEKKFNTLNFLGEQQQAHRAIKAQGDVRSELSIFYALDKFFYFSTFAKRYVYLPLEGRNFYYLSLFFSLKGFIRKPSLNKVRNRWKNLYNPFFGRPFTYRLIGKFEQKLSTKIFLSRIAAHMPARYISQYMLTHTFTRASHFLALANARFSYNISNFN